MNKSNKLTRRHYLRLEASLKYFNLNTLTEKDLKRLRGKSGFKDKRTKTKFQKQKETYKKNIMNTYNLLPGLK